METAGTTGINGEQTVIRTLNLPEGTDWVWYGDANVVGLSSRLDCAGRLRAFEEMQAWWKRAHLRLVESTA